MGRIKTKLTKRLTLELLDKHRDKLSTEFEANKKLVAGLMAGTSKKLRNVIAGYVTRLKKKD
ncbi:30S ribosomal protein S17e [Candidatus Woesearchaeota archaeon]|nr:30S ribosomal protein S17e [Candidatus Woesearchaeota archaeon]